MKILWLVSFFFICQWQLQLCVQHNQYQSLSMHSLSDLDLQSHRAHPVKVSKNPIRLLIVPHGQDEHAQNLMAATYAILEHQVVDRVILICSADSILFHGVALPYLFNDSCLTQGLPIDSDIIEELSQHSLFNYYQQPFCHNLSMQFQCRLLQFYLRRNIKVIPLFVGQLVFDDARSVAAMLASYCDDTTLVAISADIASYQHCLHDRPLDQSQLCKVYDQDAWRIQAIQAQPLSQHAALFDTGSLFAIFFELLQLPHFKHVESYFVGYDTSCYDCKAPMKDIVTYGAFIVQASQSNYRNVIGCYEQLQLLQHARVGLQSLFELSVVRLPCMISYEMSQPHGVFASLYMMSDHGVLLQGCMGKASSKLSLYDLVYSMTQQAACYDMRFCPLRQADVDNTIISLSVITDYMKIKDFSQIDQSHGVVLQYDDKEAVSLPVSTTVANWDYQAVLMYLSNQIGLHDFIWKQPRAKIFTFQSTCFQEA